MELTFQHIFSRAKITQADAARKSGVAQSRVSRLLDGSAMLRDEDALKLAPALKCSVDELRIVGQVQRIAKDLAAGRVEPDALRSAVKSVSKSDGLSDPNRTLLVALMSLADAADAVSKQHGGRLAGLGRDGRGVRLRGRGAQKEADERALSENEYDADARSQFLGRDAAGRRRPERERKS